MTTAPDWPLAGRLVAYRCDSCDLLFSWPQPTPEHLADFYSPTGGWGQTHADRFEAATHKTKGAAGRALIARIDALVPDTARRVLDFGCGTGRWLNAFADAGWQTWGIEPATDVAFARHARVDAIPDDGRFECVLAYHVLEHLPRPLDALRQFAAALRPGGVCVVSVPRLDTVDVHQDRTYCLNGRAHLVAYSEACLRDLFQRAGFTRVIDAHDLDGLFTQGRPVRMRLIAQREGHRA